MSLIFDIKRYAINDGPGIRITLFMKGSRSRAYGAIIPKAFVTEKTNYTQPRNASAVELV